MLISCNSAYTRSYTALYRVDKFMWNKDVRLDLIEMLNLCAPFYNLCKITLSFATSVLFDTLLFLVVTLFHLFFIYRTILGEGITEIVHKRLKSDSTLRNHAYFVYTIYLWSNYDTNLCVKAVTHNAFKLFWMQCRQSVWMWVTYSDTDSRKSHKIWFQFYLRALNAK